MNGGVTSAVIGKWRIFEADLWERGYLDLVEPAHITFDAKGHGEFAFHLGDEAILKAPKF